MVDHQIGRPTFNRDLARAIMVPVRRGAHGTVHATNARPCCWYEFAHDVEPAARLDGVRVDPEARVKSLERHADLPIPCSLGPA
jgi:dTDP-4-dehydrorhamnose reductase